MSRSDNESWSIASDHSDLTDRIEKLGVKVELILEWLKKWDNSKGDFMARSNLMVESEKSKFSNSKLRKHTRRISIRKEEESGKME